LRSSALTPPRGSTTPRLWTRPLVRGRKGQCGCGCALTAKTSLGFSAVEFAEEVLGIDLMPWQRWLLIHALELRPDGRFRFRTVLVLVARQNGKTTVVEVKNLWKMFVLRVPLVIGTAQNLDIAEESWDKAVEIVEGTPELAAEIEHVDKTNGKKALKIKGGPRWKIAAASRRGGRGLSGDDVNLDELREHQTWESWGAVSKTTMARKKAQVWALSNAGDDKSVVLNDLQAKGRAAAAGSGGDDTLGFFEWSAPDDCPADDESQWPKANPALGYTIEVDALRSALETDPEPVFRTECLCQRVPDLVPPKIPLSSWVRCVDEKSTMVGPIALCWEVSWDGSRAAIAAAGLRKDGRPHVELIEYANGTDWVPAWIAARASKHKVVAVVFDPRSPAGALLPEVTRALPTKLEPKPISTQDMVHACARLLDEVITEQIRHLGDEVLAEALRKSAVRMLVDSWVWDRKNSRADIAPLVAVTLARHGLAAHTAEQLVIPSFAYR